MFLFAVLLTNGAERQVVVPWLDWPLPESCMTRLQFGIDCPGCGLTRSFIHLAHGEFSEAWRLNWGSIPVFLLVIFQIPVALFHYYGKNESTKRKLSGVNLGFFLFAAGLLVCRWFVLLLTGKLI